VPVSHQVAFTPPRPSRIPSPFATPSPGRASLAASGARVRVFRLAHVVTPARLHQTQQTVSPAETPLVGSKLHLLVMRPWAFYETVRRLLHQ